MGDEGQTDLRGYNLSGAILNQCKFQQVSLLNSNLEDAWLDRSYFVDSTLRDCTFRGASIENAYFEHSNLENCECDDVSFVRTDFHFSSLSGSTCANADFRKCEGVTLDGTQIRGAIFDAGTRDSWGLLREKYTGVNFVVNMVLTLMYFIPKLTSLLLVSLGLSIQSYLANAGGVSLETVTDLCKETRECDVVPVWKFLLGNNFPDTESVVFLIFAYLVFVYQLNRYQLTKAVGYWKAHEERTGLSPPIELSSGGAVTANMSLKKLFSQHKYVQAMSFLVGGAVIWQLLSFLFGGMIVVPR